MVEKHAVNIIFIHERVVYEEFKNVEYISTRFCWHHNAGDIGKLSKGVVDENGNNLWHILADACDKAEFSEYVEQLAAVQATEEEEQMLSFLASQRNNKYQSPVEIAAENWAINECPSCGHMIKAICDRAREGRGYRSKRVGLNPFADFLRSKDKNDSIAIEALPIIEIK